MAIDSLRPTEVVELRILMVGVSAGKEPWVKLRDRLYRDINMTFPVDAGHCQLYELRSAVLET